MKVLRVSKILVVLLLCTLTVADAGVVFMDRSENSADERFPESKWGNGPLDRPISSADQFALEERTSERSERKPAGLVMEKDLRAASRAPESPFGSNAALTELIPDRKKGIQEVALIAGDLGFFPKTVFVNQNVPVRLFVTGASQNTLCVMVDAFQVRKQVRTQRIEEITFTPGSPGKFRIHCPINQMEATLVVRD